MLHELETNFKKIHNQTKHKVEIKPINLAKNSAKSNRTCGTCAMIALLGIIGVLGFMVQVQNRNFKKNLNTLKNHSRYYNQTEYEIKVTLYLCFAGS